MAKQHKGGIAWTDETWNVVTGCTPVSEGCRNCYAERYSRRGIGDFKRRDFVEDGGITLRKRLFNEIAIHPGRLEKPLHWKKPRRIFVCSMGDLFHESVPAAFIDTVFAVMALCQQHTFQVLTKRPERMRDYLKNRSGQIASVIVAYRIKMGFDDPIKPCPWICDAGGEWFPLPNVWLGATAENQSEALGRIPILLETPAITRFVSCEPLLEEINFFDWLGPYGPPGSLQEPPGLDWIIAGCESGPGRRPAILEWFADLCNQCESAGVPFLLKQMEINGQVVKEPYLDGRQWLQFPEVKA